MYRLSLGLGYSVLSKHFCLAHSLSRDERNLLNKIEQHCIVLSDKILGYYLSAAESKMDMVETDTILSYIDSLAAYEDRVSFYNTNLDDEIPIEKEFVAILSTVPLKTFVYEDELDQTQLKKIKCYTCEDIIRDKANPINLYSVPVVNYQVRSGDARDKYLKWFERLFYNEPEIIIVDRYILSSKRNVRTLNECYLKIMPKDAEVKIYTSEQEDNTIEDNIKEIVSEGRKITICKVRDGEVHDRAIWIGNVQLTIGAGLDFVNHNSNEVKRDTSISISGGEAFQEPNVIYTFSL